MIKPEKMSVSNFGWRRLGGGLAGAEHTSYPLIQAESCRKAFKLVFDFTQQDKMGMGYL